MSASRTATTNISRSPDWDKRRWSLIYPTEEEPINSPFYGQLPGIGIADLLRFVAGKTDFLSAFTHVLGRYVKQEADPRLVLACVVAMGTNMGLWKMAEVSGLGYSSLTDDSAQFPAGGNAARRQRWDFQCHSGPVDVRPVRYRRH